VEGKPVCAMLPALRPE